VAEANRRPQPFLYGSTSIGGIGHLTSELFQHVAGIKLANVPYPGDAKAVTDLLSGQLSLVFEPGFAARPLVEAGQLKALGVTSKERLAIMPQLATFSETYPGFEVSSIQALIARAATPRGVLEKLSAGIQAVVRTPEFAAQVRPIDLEPIASTPEEFNAYARREMARWKEVIERADIAPE
jgi:tripartite-type tricarboxylate transporter receptor subunit TctC